MECHRVKTNYHGNHFHGYRFTNETIVRVGDYYNRDGLQFSQSEGVEDSRDLDIEEVYRHPYYSYHSSPTNDLALIKLRQCVSFK